MDHSPGISRGTGWTPPAVGPEAGLTPSTATTIQTPPRPESRLQGQRTGSSFSGGAWPAEGEAHARTDPRQPWHHRHHRHVCSFVWTVRASEYMCTRCACVCAGLWDIYVDMRLRKQLLVYTCANTHVHVGVDIVLCACVSRVLTVSVYMHVRLTHRVNKPETAAPACALPRPRQAPVQPHRLLWPWESLCVRGGRTCPSILEEEVPHSLTAAQQAHGKLPLYLSTELLSPAHMGTHTCKDTQHTQIHAYTHTLLQNMCCTHVHTCTCMHFTHTSVCICVPMVCTCVSTHVHSHTCMCTHTHIHTCPSWQGQREERNNRKI